MPKTCWSANGSPARADEARIPMNKYFLNGREVPETDAATVWFDQAERRGIDIARAISVWEAAASPDADESRRLVEQAGIRIETQP